MAASPLLPQAPTQVPMVEVLAPLRPGGPFRVTTRREWVLYMERVRAILSPAAGPYELAANKGAASGYLGLDSNARFAATYIGAGTVDDTEFGYLNGVTSALQTQLDAKLATAGLLTALLAVDGAGSGIDADKLDGQEGAYYQSASNLNAGTIPVARLPYIGWRLDKNGSNQGSVGTGATLISWSNAGGAAWSNGVTLDLTAGNYKVTLPTAGLYISMATLRYSVVAADDILRVSHYRNGAELHRTRQRFPAGADSVMSVQIIKAAANDYLQIYGANNSNADTVEGNALYTQWVGGLFGAAA